MGENKENGNSVGIFEQMVCTGGGSRGKIGEQLDNWQTLMALTWAGDRRAVVFEATRATRWY